MKMSEEEIINRIETELKTTPNQTARQLARAIGENKKILNPLLYRSNKFVQDGSNRPLWRLNETPEKH
jgi:RNase adaptor protein for sRNA GlmZ degradation